MLKKTFFMILFILLPLLLTGCQNSHKPEQETETTAAVEEIETKLIVPVETSADLLPGIKILEFKKEGMYSIQYPDYWQLEGGQEEIGYEILTLWKKDPEVREDAGHGGQDPNSAKVALSIVPKDGLAFEEITAVYLQMASEMAEGSIEEELPAYDGKSAVRYTYNFASDTAISTLIDCGDSYVLLSAFHGSGSEANELNRDILFIHKSFKLLSS